MLGNKKGFKRKIAFTLALCMGLTVLASCGGDKTPQSETASSDAAVTTSSLGVEPIASGGKSIENANAKSAQIDYTDNKATIALQFVLGSQQQNVDEAESDGVPTYRAYVLSSPSRLVLEFDRLSYWDFFNTLSIEESNPFFYGVFNQIQLQAGGVDLAPSAFRIVFQLRQDVSATVSEKNNTLTIELDSTEQIAKKSYHIMSTAVSAFNTGELQQDVGFFPTLSSDLTNQVLISKPFDTEADAETALATVLSQNPNLLSQQNTFTVALDHNSLPSYADSADFQAVYEQYVIRIAGTPERLPVVMPDGIYLCSTDDSQLSLFSKQLTNGDKTTQELWTLSADGKMKRLMDTDFIDIASAAFSPDGKKLAFVERAGDSSYLYVFDLFSNDLDNLSEEGLGNQVSAFVWDTLGTAIYTIAGNKKSDSQQLLKYDFTVADSTLRVTAVEENEIGEGDLAFYNGEIYFTNVTDEDAEEVFHIRPEGGLREPFTQGGSFRLSKDGRYMAILRSNMASEESDEELGGQTSLVLRDMSTGEESLVVDNTFVVTYAWSSNGMLYYTDSISSDFSDEYSYRFVSFNPENQERREICEFISSDFSPAPDPNTIYVPLIRDEEDSTPIHATYSLRLDDMQSTPSSEEVIDVTQESADGTLDDSVDPATAVTELEPEHSGQTISSPKADETASQ